MVEGGSFGGGGGGGGGGVKSLISSEPIQTISLILFFFVFKL